MSARLASSAYGKAAIRLVKEAGVDLSTPGTYGAIVKRMNRIMDEIGAILARRKN